MTNSKKLKVYLAGAMEKEKDLGAGWRTEITPFLESLNLEVLNPVEFEPEQLEGLKPNRLPDYYTNWKGEQVKANKWYDFKNAREKHLYDRFLKYMRRIIKYDIKIVTKETDLIVVLWNQQTGAGAGTHAELTYGFMNNIPIYCVAQVEMPAWAKACCSDIFLTFDALKEFLKEELG